MQFVYPSFLFALAAIAIPIIIHLFHFRRYKKIIFSDLRFLKQIQEQNKSKQKLKDLLILLSRILAIVFLVLAFAQPFIPTPNAVVLRGKKAVSVFVDNSFSMNNEGPEGNFLETAKAKARAIINAYGSDDVFQVLTHDVEGKHQRLVNKTDAINWIDDIKITSAAIPLSTIINRQKQSLSKAGDDVKIAYIISDFQQLMCDISQLKIDSTLNLTLLPIASNANQQNISVDSVWFASPMVQLNQPVTVKTRIHNYSQNEVENIAVTLTMNGEKKGLQNINCDAFQFVDVSFMYTPKGQQLQYGQVSVLDNPITFDDHLYFTFTPVTQYNILTINGTNSNEYIGKLFEGDKLYNLTQASQNQLNYAVFSQHQLIILNEPKGISSGLGQELKKYIEQGGQLLVFPPTAQNDCESLNSFLSNLQLPTYGLSVNQRVKVNTLNTQDAIFKNVFERLPQNMDLPSATKFYALQPTNVTRGKQLMELNTGQPFIWQASYQKGNIVLFTAPLQASWSNLQQHAIFVPLMLKLGTGKVQNEKLYYTIGQASWIPFIQNTTSEKLIRLWGNATDMALQTSQRQGKTAFYLDQPFSKAGVYNIAPQGIKNAVQLLALNFNRSESDLQIWNTSEMELFLTQWPNAQISNEDTAVIQNSIHNKLNGTPFWRYCVLLTLVFVLIEILLLRLLK